jgi:methylase of polypeptide subunit release factors
MAEQKLSVEVGQLIEETLEQLNLEGKSKVKERGKKISTEDIKSDTYPEPFTEDNLVKPVFNLLNLEARREKKFQWGDKSRAVDYELENENGDKFLLEAKKINSNLTSNRSGAAVEQIKQVFQLSEVKQNYEFGIATDGLTWIIINKEGEEVDQLNLEKDIFRLQELLQGERKPVSERKQEEITDKFYNWYDALLHGGKYKDRNDETKHIAEEDAFVNNIYSAKDEDKPEIAQTIANRLIFIKFLQSKEIIQDDVLAELADLEQSELNRKMKELFFQVMNTPEDERVNISEEFEEIPYLNGSLFKRNDAEERNVDYQVKYDILHRFVEFLDRFAFVNEESLEEKEAIDPKILGYIFERAMTDAERKSTGAYYTPRAVTQYIAENTVYPTILEKANTYLKEEKGYNEEELYDSVDEMIRKCRSLWDIRQKILVEDFRVVDPACGSGAFLLAVANILWDIHKRIGEQLGDSEADNDAWLKKLILRHNIYGVDINHNATEIARLRLWLWLVDSFNRNNLEALPNIDYKVVSGNSLTGFADITQMKEEGELSGQNNLAKWEDENIPELFKQKNEKTTRYEEITGDEAEEVKQKIESLDDRINDLLNDYYITWVKDDGVDLGQEEIRELDVFHWGAEFSRVFDPEKEPEERGFDVIVGNPPYIRIQELKQGQEKLVELLGELDDYETPYYNYDIALPFVERSQDLMNNTGQLGFIMTSKWLQARYGQKMRAKLADEKAVTKLIDFTDQQVFKGVTTYTLILFLNKKENEVIRYGGIKDSEGSLRDKLSKVEQEINTDAMEAYDATYTGFSEKSWTFVNKTKSDILQASEGKELQEYTDRIFQGIVTGKDSVFVADVVEEKENSYIVDSDELDQEVELEKEICKPLIKGSEFKKWWMDKTDKVVLYPYNIYEEDGEREADLIEREELQEKYLQAWSYLKANEELLKSRENGKWEEKDQWHAFSRRQNIEQFNQEKAMVPVLSNRSKLSYDDGDDYVFVGGGTAGGYGISLKDSTSISYEYLVSVMNSRLLEWIVQKTSSKFRGGSYAYGKQYIEDLPIATGDQTDVIEELTEDIISLVQESREGNEDNITALENLIDFLVYEMYFDGKFDKSLLETVEGTISGISDPEEKAKKVRNSSEIEETVADMKEDEWVEIVDSDKLREKTW